MRAFAHVATALAVVVVGLAACNAITGVNEFTSPTCDECQRKECSAEYSACRADPRCVELTTCIERCAPGVPDCANRCQTLAGSDGGRGSATTDAGTAAALMACALTRCVACAPETTPPPPDAGGRRDAG